MSAIITVRPHCARSLTGVRIGALKITRIFGVCKSLIKPSEMAKVVSEGFPISRYDIP